MFDAALLFFACLDFRALFVRLVTRVVFLVSSSNVSPCVEEDSPSVELPEYSLSSSRFPPKIHCHQRNYRHLNPIQCTIPSCLFLSDHCASKIIVSSMHYRQLGTYLFASFSNHYYLPFSNLQPSSLDYLFSCHHHQVHLPEKKYQSVLHSLIVLFVTLYMS